jgi:peroxiredoxin
VFNFWQSWSAPCLKELGRLQRLHERAGARAPVIVAFHGGKDRAALDAIRKRHELRFSLVQDTDQRVARLYGVSCWPTTIVIDARGRLGRVQFGLSHEWGEAESASESSAS